MMNEPMHSYSLEELLDVVHGPMGTPERDEHERAVAKAVNKYKKSMERTSSKHAPTINSNDGFSMISKICMEKSDISQSTDIN